MGAIKNRNLPLRSEMVKSILVNMKDDLMMENINPEHRRSLIVAGAFFVVALSCSLRGNEVFFLDAFKLIEGRFLGLEEHQKLKHIVLPLRGRFKNENEERLAQLVSVNVTNSGIPVREWVELLIKQLMTEGNTEGPDFCDKEGWMLRSADIESVLFDQLRTLKESNEFTELDEVQVEAVFGISRSFRRGAQNTAVAEGVDDTAVKLVNRWRSWELLKGRFPGFDMFHHYLQNLVVRQKQLKFSLAL